MDALVDSLLPFYARERAAARPLVLAVVLETAGSTYSKIGTPLLLAQSGEYAGLISGGCLEGDLLEHASAVFADGEARIVSYDMRGADDLLFGLGAGCEGAMEVFLTRIGPDNGWQPLQAFEAALAAHRPLTVALVIRSLLPNHRAGSVVVAGVDDGIDSAVAAMGELQEPVWLSNTPQLKVLGWPLVLPPRVLLLGAGPDTQPIVGLATTLGWKLTLFDHRPAYALASRFPASVRVICGPAASLAACVELDGFDAAVVMSHHLDSDAAYLQALAESRVGYIGLLGPAPRRDRLRAMLGEEFDLLSGRLRAPVGLALGGRSSAAIALSIVAELHQWLQSRGTW